MKNSSVFEYDDSFKKEAIDLAKSLGNFSRAAKEKGIHVNTLRKWMKQEEEKEIATKNFLANDENSLFSNLDYSVLSQNGEQVNEVPISNSNVDLSQSLEYKNLYLKAQVELENERKMNEQLRKELNKAQSLIGKLYMEINRAY